MAYQAEFPLSLPMALPFQLHGMASPSHLQVRPAYRSDRAVDLIYRGIRPIARRPTHIPQLGYISFSPQLSDSPLHWCFPRPTTSHLLSSGVCGESVRGRSGFLLFVPSVQQQPTNGNHRHAPFGHRYQSNLFRCSRLHAVNLDPVALKTNVSHS